MIDGNPNPDAIGLLVTNASLDFQRFGTDYALYATGHLALVGLDGADRVRHGRRSRSTRRSCRRPSAGATRSRRTPSPSRARHHVLGRQRLHRQRQPVGHAAAERDARRLDDRAPRSAVTISGTEVVSLQGAASFSISPLNGFRLSTFKVDGFKIFGEGLDAPSGFGGSRRSRRRRTSPNPFNGKA